MDYLESIRQNNMLHPGVRQALYEEMRHAVVVSNLAKKIAEEFGGSSEFHDKIEVAGILHDIGKLRLSKYLSSDEKDRLVIEKLKYVRMHSTLSGEILKQYSYDNDIVEAVQSHHENNDGTGYPEGLRGEEIPWMAKILRVCDVFSALTSDRSYRKAFGADVAMEIMIDEVQAYDMRVFLAFQRVFHEGIKDQIAEIHQDITVNQRKHLTLFEREAGIFSKDNIAIK